MNAELRKLTVDLERAGAEAERRAVPALAVEGSKMKTEWRQAVTGPAWRQAANAINYDIIPLSLRGVAVDVGYDQRGMGELGNIIEFGTSTQGPIRPAGARVLKDGADRLEKYMSGISPL